MILNLVHWPAGGWEPDKERTPGKSASGASLGEKSDLQDRPGSWQSRPERPSVVFKRISCVSDEII